MAAPIPPLPPVTSALFTVGVLTAVPHFGAMDASPLEPRPPASRKHQMRLLRGLSATQPGPPRPKTHTAPYFRPRKPFDGGDEVACDVIQAIAIELDGSCACQKSRCGDNTGGRCNQCSVHRHGLSGIFNPARRAEPAVRAQWVFR